MVNNPTINLKDLARAVSYDTGTKIKDVEAILLSALDNTAMYLGQGCTVKLHKTMKLVPEVKPGYTAFAGLSKEYYDRPDKTYVKVIPLVNLEDRLKEKDERAK